MLHRIQSALAWWSYLMLDLLAAILLFSVLFWLLGGTTWLSFAQPSENGLYILSGQSIPLLWEKLVAVRTVGDFLRWIPGCIFQLAPMEDAESPLYVVTLAYWKLVSDGLLHLSLPHFLTFNMGCLTLMAFMVIRIFRQHQTLWAGPWVAILLLVNITVLTSAVGLSPGNHGTLGCLLVLILLHQHLKLTDSNPLRGRQMLGFGILCSITFFTAHHVIPLVPFFAGLALANILLRHISPRQKVALVSMLALGGLSLLIYYGLRDWALYSGLLDAFRRPDFAATARFPAKYPYALGAVFGEASAVSLPTVPVDFTYFVWLFTTNEGPWFLLGPVLGLGVGLAAARANRSLKSAGPMLALLWLIAGHIILIAVMPLPQVSRTYVPTAALLSVLTGVGLSAFSIRHGRAGMGVGLVLLLLLTGAQVFNYVDVLKRLDSHQEDYAVGANVNPKDISGPSDIVTAIEAFQREGISQVTVPPLIFGSAPGTDRRLSIHCFFAALKERGLEEGPVYLLDPIVTAAWINEHMYFQIFAGVDTFSGPDCVPCRSHGSLVSLLEEKLGPVRQIRYQISDALPLAYTADWDALSCAHLRKIAVARYPPPAGP